MIEFETYRAGDFLHVQVQGIERLDASVSTEFKERIAEVVQSTPLGIVLDLALVRKIDSTGIGAIVFARKQVQAPRVFRLENVNPVLMGIFRILKIDRFLDADPGSGQDAREALQDTA